MSTVHTDKPNCFRIVKDALKNIPTFCNCTTSMYKCVCDLKSVVMAPPSDCDIQMTWPRWASGFLSAKCKGSPNFRFLSSLCFLSLKICLYNEILPRVKHDTSEWRVITEARLRSLESVKPGLLLPPNLPPDPRAPLEQCERQPIIGPPCSPRAPHFMETPYA